MCVIRKTIRFPRRKLQSIRSVYKSSNSRFSESAEDTDDQSVISDDFRRNRSFAEKPVSSTFSPFPRTIQPSKMYGSVALSRADIQSAPPELTSFIKRQEDYIEQLERESQYCRDKLINLLSKVREVQLTSPSPLLPTRSNAIEIINKQIFYFFFIAPLMILRRSWPRMRRCTARIRLCCRNARCRITEITAALSGRRSRIASTRPRASFARLTICWRASVRNRWRDPASCTSRESASWRRS